MVKFMTYRLINKFYSSFVPFIFKKIHNLQIGLAKLLILVLTTKII